MAEYSAGHKRSTFFSKESDERGGRPTLRDKQSRGELFPRRKKKIAAVDEDGREALQGICMKMSKVPPPFPPPLATNFKILFPEGGLFLSERETHSPAVAFCMKARRGESSRSLSASLRRNEASSPEREARTYAAVREIPLLLWRPKGPPFQRENSR